MRLGEIYSFFIQQGIKKDLRTPLQIRKKLLDVKKEFQKLSREEKKFFDKESFTNPFSDTRILNGDLNVSVKRILVGIDIEVGEILLAERLSGRGKKIDLIFAHHPEGKALAGLYDVMGLQADYLESLGFDRKVADELMGQRMNEVARRLHGANHTRAVDAAKLLGIPLLCCHTPSDNFVTQYLQGVTEHRKSKSLGEIISLLLKEPEYQDAAAEKAGPKILIGKPKDKPGKIVVDMTGGTEGSKEIFARLSQAGVGTLLCMHLSEEHYKKVKPEHINVIIAGHMASDNLGINLLLDQLEKKDSFEFIACSGFRRVRR